MNLKFMDASASESWQFDNFVIVKNKLMSVLNASVLLLIMNFVITLSHEVSPRATLTLLSCLAASRVHP